MGETTNKIGPLKDQDLSSLETTSSYTITPHSDLSGGTSPSSYLDEGITSHSHLSTGAASSVPATSNPIDIGTTGTFGTPGSIDTPVAPSSITPATDTGGGDEAAQIRSGIEHTRADLSQTISALQDKLDPSHIAEQVKEQIREKAVEAIDSAKHTVKEATIGKAGKFLATVSDSVSGVISGPAGTTVKETSSSIVEYIRENPIPLALVGLGVGMLTFGGRKRTSYSYSSGQPSRYNTSEVIDLQTGKSSLTDRAKDVLGGVAESTRGVLGGVADSTKGVLGGVAETTKGAAGTVAEKARLAAEQATGTVNAAASTVRDAAGTAADAARRQLHDVNDQARQGVRMANERLKSTLQENPLALGIAAIAAGALIGLTLPSTQLEAEYMGDARDSLMDQAKSAAQEAAKKVQHVAEEAGHSLKDVVQKEGLIPEEKSAS